MWGHIFISVESNVVLKRPLLRCVPQSLVLEASARSIDWVFTIILKHFLLLFPTPFFSLFHSLCWHVFIRIFLLLLITDDVSSSHLTAKPDWNGHLLNGDAMYCATSSCAAQAGFETFLPPLLIHNLLSLGALSKNWNYNSAALIVISIIKTDSFSLDATQPRNNTTNKEILPSLRQKNSYHFLEENSFKNR